MKDDKVKLLILCSWKQFSITSPYMTYQKKSYFPIYELSKKKVTSPYMTYQKKSYFPIYGLFIREVKMFSALSFSKLFILGSLMTRNLFKAGPFHVPTHYWVNPGYTTLPARTVYQVLHIRLTNWKMEVMKKNAKRSLLSVIFNPLGKKKKNLTFLSISLHLPSYLPATYREGREAPRCCRKLLKRKNCQKHKI